MADIRDIVGQSGPAIIGTELGKVQVESPPVRGMVVQVPEGSATAPYVAVVALSDGMLELIAQRTAEKVVAALTPNADDKKPDPDKPSRRRK